MVKKKVLEQTGKDDQIRSLIFRILTKESTNNQGVIIKQVIHILEGHYSFSFSDLDHYPVAQSQLLTLISKLTLSGDYHFYFPFIKTLIKEEW